jgi:hypothetical protein
MIDDLRTVAPALLGHSQSLIQTRFALSAASRLHGDDKRRSVGSFLKAAPVEGSAAIFGTESLAQLLPSQTGVAAMRRAKPQPSRNKLDLNDRKQVRLVRKRLGLSDAELSAIVGRIGNSISAISKQAALQRATVLPKPADVPAAAVIVSATSAEPVTTEVSTTVPGS